MDGPKFSLGIESALPCIVRIFKHDLGAQTSAFQGKLTTKEPGLLPYTYKKIKKYKILNRASLEFHEVHIS